jgi:hypothetical protein
MPCSYAPPCDTIVSSNRRLLDNQALTTHHVLAGMCLWHTALLAESHASMINHATVEWRCHKLLRRRTFHALRKPHSDTPHPTIADVMLAALVFEDIARPNATIEIGF